MCPKNAFKVVSICLILLVAAPQKSFAKEIVEERGGKVKAVKYDDGTWELLVDNKPYFIKSVVFNPVHIGESPDVATQRDWMLIDDDNDGRSDVAYQTWIDENKNNKRDENEPIAGDFALLRDMGANTIRLYHVPSDHELARDIYNINAGTGLQYDHALNKELLRDLYNSYGIRVIVSHFLGSWTLGAGVAWEEGVDYTNPVHRENIKRSVKAMVLDSKDEPYVLMWLLGNENNIASWSNMNAGQEPEAYASLVGEITAMIKELDPEHPVAICDGDSLGHKMLSYYARLAPGC